MLSLYQTGKEFVLVAEAGFPLYDIMNHEKI